MKTVGLDIGSRTIKIVELERNGENYALAASGVVGYKGEPIEKLTEERDLATVADIIAKLVKSANVTSKDVSISLPENLVFTRTIRLPLLTDQEVAAAIKWEADQYIPIPVKEAIIQHQVIYRQETGGSPHVKVLLVAAPRALVEKYVALVQMAKLNVVAVETEMMSVVRALAPTNQTSLIIDFGARSVDLAIAKNGLFAFSRSIITGGDAITRALANTLSVSAQEAEEYKRAYGLSSNQLEGKIRMAVEPIVKGITDEIKKAIQFYQTDEKGEAPTSTIISGGVAGMPELISYMTSSLGNEILIANPFSKVNVNENTWKNLAPYSPLYCVAVGLAMR